MTELERKIRLYSQMYYQDGSSPVTDFEFDHLVDLLKEENPNSDILKCPSFGYNVDEDNTEGEKYKHRYGLVSGLDKAYTFEELPKHFRNIFCYASPKLDGMSIALYYENGKLVQALTRGDYTYGKDVTNKVRMIIGDNITDYYFTGGVRGEIIMSKRNYKKYLENHQDAKNPRNVVAGIINSKKITEDIKYLDIVVYTVLAAEGYAKNFGLNGDGSIHNREVDQVYNFLMRNYDHVAEYRISNTLSNTQESSFEYQMQYLKSIWDQEYPYEIDGIVLCIGTIDVKISGEFVYDEIAFKFRAESAETEVESIEWKMSKTHYAVPIVCVKEVQLSGTSVKRATGFNAKYILENKIVPGAIVEIEKHGEIIPNINKVVSHPDITVNSIPDKCPECGEPLQWDGVHLVCRNPVCGNTILHDMLIWIDSLAPLDNFGDKLRLKYLRTTLDMQDISVETVMEDSTGILHELSLLGEIAKKYSKQQALFAQMLHKLFYEKFSVIDSLKALNIPRLGDRTCEKLSEYTEVVKRIYDVAIHDKDILELFDLNGYIGDANADSIRKHIVKFKRWRYIYDRIEWDSSETSEDHGSVAITGKLSVPRKQFENELASFGWSVGSITKKTKYLITDDPDSNSSKNKKAEEYGIEKITELEFRKKYMK